MATSEAIEVAGAEQSDRSSVVPLWGQIVAAIVLIAFLAVGVVAFAGPGLRRSLTGWLPGVGGQAGPVPGRVLYQPGSTAGVGAPSVGSTGQDRKLLEGDTVVLGESGRLVRLQPAGQSSEVAATNGATTLVTNVGAWDANTDRLAGVTARYQGGRWALDPFSLANVGAALHPPGAPAEALTEGFALGPDADAAALGLWPSRHTRQG